MKKQTITALSICFMLANESFAQFAAPPTFNTATQVTGGDVGIGTVAPAARLDVLSTGNQLRLSNSSSIFSDIQTTSAGYLFLNPSGGSAGRIGIGTSSPLVGFHSNMGVFRITDPGSTTRGFQVSPNYTTPNGDIPAGTVVLTPITASGEGLSFASSGSGATGVKIGTYAYNGSTWFSMWETQNVGFGFPTAYPNLLLARTAGNVAIGTTTPRAKLDVVGNARIGADGAGVTTIDPTTALTIYQNATNSKALKFNTWNNALSVISIENVNFPGKSPFTVFGDGRTWIGDKTQTSVFYNTAMLTVNGLAVAKEIVVTQLTWADNVFAKEYKLPNIYDVENYYKANKHLPEIPSETEVMKDGVNVGEMEKLLLKKIEELTLYIVEQKKESDRQLSLIEGLNTKLNKLETK